MQCETRLFILGTLVAVSIFCGLYLLLAVQPAAAPALAGKAISLVEAPLVAKVLVGLAVLVSGGLLLAPFLQAEWTAVHQGKQVSRFGRE